MICCTWKRGRVTNKVVDIADHRRLQLVHSAPESQAPKTGYISALQAIEVMIPHLIELVDICARVKRGA
jgi:hypothetical protein